MSKINALLAAPLIIIVVSRPVAEWEQGLSARAVCMNLITTATVLGYGSNWFAGRAASDPAAQQILGLEGHERIAGIILIGTSNQSPQERLGPSLQRLITTWSAP